MASRYEIRGDAGPEAIVPLSHGGHILPRPGGGAAQHPLEAPGGLSMSETPGQEPIDNSASDFDGDFDAERAKTLIEKLREENAALKSDKTPQDQKDARVIAALRRQLDELKPKADQFTALEEASKSEAQRLAEAAEAAKRDAEMARAEAIRYRAAATHGLGADHFDLLGSGTEEEISARAEKIAALLAAQAGPAPATAPQTRPVEQMRPGATPGEAESADDVLYKQLFG